MIRKVQIFLQTWPNEKLNSARLLAAFFVSLALLRTCGLHTMNVLGLIFFLFALLLFTKNSDYQKEGKIPQTPVFRLVPGILGALFTILYLTGSYQKILSDLSNTLFRILIFAASSIGLWLLFRAVILLVMALTTNLPDAKKKRVNKLPLITLILGFLCKIPWFLYEFPGVLTPDSINQLEQLEHLVPYSNHHPFVHTLTVGLVYLPAKAIFGTPNAGVACYILFQMLLVSLAAAFCVRTIERYSSHRIFGILACLFYCLLPYNNIMAVTLWKDALFSATLLVFGCCLYELLREKEKTGLMLRILTGFSGVLMALYRSNGFYAFVAVFVILGITCYRNRKVLAPIFIPALLLVLIVRGPVMDAYDVTQPDFTESLSIPLQMIAGTIADGGELTSDELALLEKAVDVSYISQLYDPTLSDPMKELLRAGDPEYVKENIGGYTRLWCHLMLRYPGSMIKAYIRQTEGYYNPLDVYPSAETEGIVGNDLGIYTHQIIHGQIPLKIREILIKLQNIIPLYGILWSMGSLLWVSFLCLAISLGRGIAPKAYFLTAFPTLCVIGTLLLATPVAHEFRYGYGLVFSIPLLLGLSFASNEESYDAAR